MAELPKHWNASQRRGYLIAREFLVLQGFLWAALLIGGLTYLTADYSSERERAFPVFLITFVVTYFPVQYIRSVLSAWRIFKRRQEPPEVTAEEERERVKDVQDVLGNLMSGR